MAEDRPKGPNPFVVARRSASVTVELRTEDVMSMRPSWDHARAAHFLMTHRHAIGAQVLATGLGVLLATIEAEEQCNGPMN
jgi:hypothetical protein